MPSEPPPTGLLYPHDANLPPGKALLAGFQQVIAMFIGCITPVLIFTSVVEVTPDMQRYMISMSLLSAALGTFLQAKRIGIIGSGLLSINGTSFAYVDLLLRAGAEGGVSLACGMALAAVPVQFLLAFFLPRLKRVFSPLVAGIVVLLIGIDLIPVAGYYIAKGVDDTHGWQTSVFLALLVVVILVVSQVARRPMLRLCGPLLAIATGYIISSFLGLIDWNSLSNASFIMPQPFVGGLSFKAELLLPFMIIYIVSSLEAIGDLSATAALSGLKTEGEAFWKRLRGGILSDAITSVFATCLSVFPTATFSQNNGVIQLTGVGSRKVGYYVAGILALTAIIPQTGIFFSIMPTPVLGGVTLVLFGLIGGAGLRMIQLEKLGNDEVLVIAVSLGVALGIPSQEDLVAKLPGFLQAIFSSSVATGGLVAIIMNFICLRTRNTSVAEEAIEAESAAVVGSENG